MREKCVEITLWGRCQQKRNDSTRCYYHEKIKQGLTTKADIITVLDDDGDDF